ncbi:STAS domain-containing protein [Streptomyces sp. NPDC047315]|uniref:STAS domain-containing protein n=1 Tax=Streptomyces sp. NPDC047315 TaxID=3155142 RepID=UPI0033C92743
MTIEWRYTTRPGLGVLSLSGHLGPDAVKRFHGAIDWVAARGTGPVILDLTQLRGWSTDGQLAIIRAARLLASHERPLHLAAIPADGSLVPNEGGPRIPVHGDLPTALAVHPTVTAATAATADRERAWRTSHWPDARPSTA